MPTLVLDNGADRLKVGFAGDPAPRFLMPNCTAKLKGQLQVSGAVEGVLLRLAATGKELVSLRADLPKYCQQAWLCA